jgi:hypothetical protein
MKKSLLNRFNFFRITIDQEIFKMKKQTYKQKWNTLKTWCEAAEEGHHNYGKDYTQAFSNICKRMQQLEENEE